MELTKTQAEALAAWAEECRRQGGTTGWGPKFNEAMKVAHEVREAHVELYELKAWRFVSDYCAKVKLLISVSEEGIALFNPEKPRTGKRYATIIELADALHWDAP